jgi:hypothetical protein
MLRENWLVVVRTVRRKIKKYTAEVVTRLFKPCSHISQTELMRDRGELPSLIKTFVIIYLFRNLIAKI